jgi:uncharacterized membrane protein YGL010W
MKTIDKLLSQYGESHQHPTNKLIHWVCVPVIMFSLVGLLMSIPFPGEKAFLANWGTVALALALLYYLRLSVPLFIGFLLIAAALIYGNYAIWLAWDQSNLYLLYTSIAVFIVAWIGQFYGHKVEGKKPSFLKDVQFLLIGPAWLLHFIYRRWNIPY